MTKIFEYDIVSTLETTERLTLYQARQPGTDRPLTVKWLKATRANSSDIALSKREFDRIREIEGECFPNIVDVRAEDNGLFIASTPVYCEPLIQYKDDDNPLRSDMEKFLWFAIRLTAAVEKMHEKNIIHKGLSPHNIGYNRATLEIGILRFGAEYIVTEENQNLYDDEVIQTILPYVSP